MNDRDLFNRRNWLKTIGGAGISVALAGCAMAAPQKTGTPQITRALSRKPFVAPRISHDRIVRVIAGHRPFRPSGFVVKSEQMDDKVVVHNYGHGGGGLSLCWGSSALAVREVNTMNVGKAAVIGGGAMGLSTARLLQDAGWEVTIYTRDALRHTTSSVAVGHWSPSSVFEEGHATAEFKSQLLFASRISHHAFQTLIGAGYGVSWIENYNLSEQPIEHPYYLKELPELYPLVADLEPHEHPFPASYVQRVVTMLIEPAVYLRRVREDFFHAGGRLEMRSFAHVSEVLSLDEPVIFNCTGLGAARLFNDEELVPVKGQLVFTLPDPEVDYLTSGGGAGMLHMVPRIGELVLGGTHAHGDWSKTIDDDETDRIISENQKLFSNFR